jgi:hypothetical protein
MADSWRLQAGTATLNSVKRDDDLPPVEKVLYTALQQRGFGLVGEHGSAVNTGGEGEEVPIQGDNDIPNNTSGQGESLGNTQGKHLDFFPQRGTDIVFSNNI